MGLLEFAAGGVILKREKKKKKKSPRPIFRGWVDEMPSEDDVSRRTGMVVSRKKPVEKPVEKAIGTPTGGSSKYKCVDGACGSIKKPTKEARTSKGRDTSITEEQRETEALNQAKKLRNSEEDESICQCADCIIERQRKATKPKVNFVSGKHAETEHGRESSGRAPAVKGGRQKSQQGQQMGGGQQHNQNSSDQGPKRQNNAPITMPHRFTQPQDQRNALSGTTENTPFETLTLQEYNLMAHSLAPSRKEVVIRQDVIENPGDPPPNAYFDTTSGLVRVYHGSIYGNPNPALLSMGVRIMPSGSRPLMIGRGQGWPIGSGMGMGVPMGPGMGMGMGGLMGPGMGMGVQMGHGMNMGGQMGPAMGGQMGTMVNPMTNAGYYPQNGGINNYMMSGGLGTPNYGPFFGPYGGPGISYEAPFPGYEGQRQTQHPLGGWASENQQRSNGMRNQNSNSRATGRSGRKQNEGQSGGADGRSSPPPSEPNNNETSNDYDGQNGDSKNYWDDQKATSDGNGVSGDWQSGAKKSSPNPNADGGANNRQSQRVGSNERRVHNFTGPDAIPGSWPSGGKDEDDENQDDGVITGNDGASGWPAPSNPMADSSWYKNNYYSNSSTANNDNGAWEDSNTGNQKPKGTQNSPLGNSGYIHHFARRKNSVNSPLWQTQTNMSGNSWGPAASNGPTAPPDHGGSRPRHNFNQFNNRKNTGGGGGGGKGKGKWKAKNSGGGNSGGDGNQGGGEWGPEEGADGGEGGDDVPWGGEIKQADWADPTMAASGPSW